LTVQPTRVNRPFFTIKIAGLDMILIHVWNPETGELTHQGCFVGDSIYLCGRSCVKSLRGGIMDMIEDKI